MKHLFWTLTFISFVPVSSANPFQEYRFVTVKKATALSALPPELEVTFEKICNEDFVKVVREDFEDPVSKKTFVAIGVLVKPNPIKSCAGVIQQQTVKAGSLFSGRDYEITLIKK